LEDKSTNINIGYTLIGGGLITAGVAGIYYTYSKDSLIKEYVELVKDYEREYKEFGRDGEISRDENRILTDKADRLRGLEDLIKQKGWGVDLLDALAKLGIIALLYKITPGVIDYIMRKYPPPGSTVCPICHKDLHTMYRLRRHLEKKHSPKPQDNPEARDAWDIIQDLPQWALDMIATLTELFEEFYSYLGKAVEDIPPEVWFMIAVIAILIIAVFFPQLLPGVAPALA